MSIPIDEIENFNPENIEWNIYKDRLENVFKYYADPKRKALLLSMKVNADVYKVLQDMCHPNDVSSKTYDEMATELNIFHGKPTSIFQERIEFYENKEKVYSYYCRIKVQQEIVNLKIN